MSGCYNQRQQQFFIGWHGGQGRLQLSAHGLVRRGGPQWNMPPILSPNIEEDGINLRLDLFTDSLGGSVVLNILDPTAHVRTKVAGLTDKPYAFHCLQ